MDVIVADLDGGSIRVPESLTVSLLPEPFWSQTHAALSKVDFTGSVIQSLLLFLFFSFFSFPFNIFSFLFFLSIFSILFSSFFPGILHFFLVLFCLLFCIFSFLLPIPYCLCSIYLHIKFK